MKQTRSPEWSVYLIRCGDGSLYTGIALDVARRFEQHSSGDPKGAKYLRGRGPLELVFECPIGERGLALKVEGRIKKLPRAQKERLLVGDAAAEKILAVARG